MSSSRPNTNTDDSGSWTSRVPTGWSDAQTIRGSNRSSQRHPLIDLLHFSRDLANAQPTNCFTEAHLSEILCINAESNTIQNLRPYQINEIRDRIPRCNTPVEIARLLQSWFDIYNTMFFGGGMRLWKGNELIIRLLMYLGHEGQFVDCRGDDGNWMNINYYNIVSPYNADRVEHVYISTLLHAMLHRFLEKYACNCPTCIPALDRNKGVLRRASHGPNWANAMVAIGQAMQDLVNWEVDVGIELSVGNDMRDNYWLATPDQRRRWAVDEGSALVRGRHSRTFLENARAEVEERERREMIALREEQRREEDEELARRERRREGQREIEEEAAAREVRRAENEEILRIRRAQREQAARLERERDEATQANQERAERLRLREEEAHRLREAEARRHRRDPPVRRRSSRDGQAHQGRAGTQQAGGPSGPRPPRDPRARKETPAEAAARQCREADHAQAQLRRLQLEDWERRNPPPRRRKRRAASPTVSPPTSPAVSPVARPAMNPDEALALNMQLQEDAAAEELSRALALSLAVEGDSASIQRRRSATDRAMAENLAAANAPQDFEAANEELIRRLIEEDRRANEQPR